jgi:nickel-dependent lactate racemase
MTTESVLAQVVDEDGPLDEAALRGVVAEAFEAYPVTDKKVLCVIPDQTRSMPLPTMFHALCDTLLPQAAQLDFLVALGTHPPLSEERLRKLCGTTAEELAGPYQNVAIFNHDWKGADALVNIGRLTDADMAQISGGMLRRGVDVTVNKRILDYDVLCVVGPVFPHEVVGFSGGNKYFFPGIAGQEIIDVFHWLGALISNPVINGVMETPVREVVDRAAEMIPRERIAFCLNVKRDACHGVFFGAPEPAWRAAADMSSRTHVLYKDRPYDSVLAVAPEMYDEIWVAGKCMYKLEPVVADGGELIIYAPHIREISLTHGDYIREIGYHTRDYFLAQMDRFSHIPGGILAHSTHVRGIGSYENGVEAARIHVTLATAIPEDECAAINLGYRDPASIDPEDWRNREEQGRLLVPHAGEVLYRLRAGNPEPAPYRPA